VDRMRRRAGLAAAALLAMGLAGCGSVSGLETQARILSQPSCSDFFFPVYFKDNSADIPKAAARVVNSAGARSKDCRIDEVKAVGLPDYRTPGDPKLALARDRARQLAALLKGAGFAEPVFQLSELGDAGATLPDARLPQRRVMVYVRFAK